MAVSDRDTSCDVQHDENDDMLRLRFVGRRDLTVPGKIKEENIMSKFGTVRGVRNRVRAGIASFSGGARRSKKLADEQGKIVVYTTSMTAVRSRFEQCSYVKRIFTNLRVKVEERDVFMNAYYQSELDERVGRGATVPHVFISGQHVGGVEKVEELNETGELGDLVAGFEQLDSNSSCSLCGGHRFIACNQCSGSKKGVRNSFTVLRCTACNEAGLMKCPECNTPPPEQS